jgi:proprotein convertase subtilisin/kexin type 5
VWLYCATCITTRCTSCGWSHYLNSTTSSYFTYPDQSCVLCSAIPYCTKCTNGPICITCDSGYFVDNGTCLECRFPCLTCTSRNTCQSCNSTTQEFLLYSDSCVPCWEHPQTQNCSLCTFSGPTTYNCYKCLDGFYLSGSTCQLCIDPCSTCSGSANCTSCVSL